MWKVLPHAPIEKLEDNLWCVEGQMPGMAPSRRMSVIRLGDGRLVIHSPVALGQEAMAEIDGFGPVAFLIVPNGLHRMDAPAFRERYPDAKLVCPDGAAPRVGKVVAVDGGLDTLPDDPALRWSPLADNRLSEVAFVVTHGDGGTTVILNDAVFNLQDRGGFAGFMLRLIGSSGGPRVTPTGRLLMVRDPAAFAGALRELAAVEGLRRVVVSHGDVIDQDAAATLRAVADRLSPA